VLRAWFRQVSSNLRSFYSRSIFIIWFFTHQNLAFSLFKLFDTQPSLLSQHSIWQSSKLSSGSFCSFAFFLFLLRILKNRHPIFPCQLQLFHRIIFTASSLLFSSQTGFTELSFSSFNQ